MKLFAKLGLIALALCSFAVPAEAQNRVVVRQNGQTVIVVTVPRQERQRPQRPPRCEHRRQSGRHFHVKPRLPGRYDPVIHIFRPSCR